jgi:hypothetical protein
MGLLVLGFGVAIGALLLGFLGLMLLFALADNPAHPYTPPETEPAPQPRRRVRFVPSHR